MTLKEKQARLEIIIAEMESLQAARDRYKELSFERYRLQEEIDKITKERILNTLKEISQFQDCVFPEIGSAGELGSALFSTEAFAIELCKTLSPWSGNRWYNIHWEGPGKYDLLPRTEYDRDGDWRYIGTFVKAEE